MKQTNFTQTTAVAYWGDSRAVAVAFGTRCVAWPRPLAAFCPASFRPEGCEHVAIVGDGINETVSDNYLIWRSETFSVSARKKKRVNCVC